MLIEAAQHLGKHPGPLGHFFRRLARKKNRNVAVVAAARKLAMIGWRMLVRNEPYRYAIPKSTESKLARLRVKATGARRKGGSPKGTKCVAKLPGGSRAIRSLEGVCRVECLPAPQPLSPGERHTVKAAHCKAFVAEIAAEHTVPRRKSPRDPQPATQRHDALPQADSAKPDAAPASCQDFRPHRAGEQGRLLPPPAPPASLFSAVPVSGKAAAKPQPLKKSTHAS
jgi:hypothetical protein